MADITVFSALILFAHGLPIEQKVIQQAGPGMMATPPLRLAGIRGEAGHLTAIGLFLGTSYGAGLLIREARLRAISSRQIFLSCVFMGFAHSVIEDTLLMVSLGADIYSILVGRLAFAVVATAAIAALLGCLSDETFLAHIFRLQGIQEEGIREESR